MQIREATETDIPAIVDLLKLSLGETLMPKSESYWRWKHAENPFGKSPVLLCYEGQTLIGVRAFMRWRWIQNGKIFHAVRAVDTATHPSYQGKGIFKKLTLALVDSCKKESIDFVFNTPNEQSKPGYIKMGWVEAGKLPIALNIRRPFRLIGNIVGQPSIPSTEDENGNLATILKHRQLPELLKINQEHDNIVTDRSIAFLKWRYLHVPVVKYIGMCEMSGNELLSVVIARIKQTKFGRELRITDCFFSHSSVLKVVKKRLRDQLQLWDIDYCTCSGLSPWSVKMMGELAFKLRVGPVVTIRPVNSLDLGNLENFKSWSPTLGDLELF